jgi:hypothetical protein
MKVIIIEQLDFIEQFGFIEKLGFYFGALSQVFLFSHCLRISIEQVFHFHFSFVSKFH